MVRHPGQRLESALLWVKSVQPAEQLEGLHLLLIQAEDIIDLIHTRLGQGLSHDAISLLIDSHCTSGNADAPLTETRGFRSLCGEVMVRQVTSA